MRVVHASVAFVAAVCSSDDTKKSSSASASMGLQDNRTSIAGTLIATDPSGQAIPVEGAEVNLQGAGQEGTIRTASNGTFTLEVPDSLMTKDGEGAALLGLAANWHAIHPHHHVGEKQTNVQLRLGERNDLGIVSMQPNGVIKGRVTPPYVGVGLKGATVSVVGTTYSVTTSDDGRFELRDIPPARWTVRVTAKEGTTDVSVLVESGKEVGVGSLSVKPK